MYTITINWYDDHCEIDDGSDFLDSLKNLFPIKDKSEEEIDKLIYDRIDNLPYNHYGLFSQQLKIKHIYNNKI